jgi:preprotein translocase subunit YajC
VKTQAEVGVPPAPPSGAAPEPGGVGSLFQSPLLVLAAMLLLMWALLIRPQQKKEKELRAMLSKVDKGDSIVTTGGLHGKVTGVTDDVLTVELAPNVRVKVSRSAVATRVPTKSEGEKS